MHHTCRSKSFDTEMPIGLPSQSRLNLLPAQIYLRECDGRWQESDRVPFRDLEPSLAPKLLSGRLTGERVSLQSMDGHITIYLGN